ncbi:response regulator [bacterium]|nr:response regulator [bacterium]
MNDRKKRVLVVDDEESNRSILDGMLEPLGYEVMAAASGRQALDLIREREPDVILLDVMMPGMNGFQVLEILKADDATRNIPIVVVTALNEKKDRVEALRLGANDFLSKPVDQIELRARVASLMEVKAYYDHLRAYQKRLETEVAERTEELNRALRLIKGASLDTILRLSRAAEFKDGETFAHVVRVAHYASTLARAAGHDEQTVEAMLYSAPLHDIGKVGLPDRILLKPTRLTPDEEEVMRRHTIIGAKILEKSDSRLIRFAEVIARSHHERWDGGGYPDGLAGEDIPLAGRITTVADVFDALTTERPYKSAYSTGDTLDYIRRERGRHFDPVLVDALLDRLDEVLSIRERFADRRDDLFDLWLDRPEEIDGVQSRIED